MASAHSVGVICRGGSFVYPLLIGLLALCGVAAAGDDVEQLYKVAGDNDMVTAKQLLAASVEVNAKSSDGSQALNAAAVFNHYDMIKLLLAHGADPNARNKEGDTPLICATKYAGGNPTTVRLLVDAGTNLGIADRTGKTALDYAMKLDQRDAIALLLQVE